METKMEPRSIAAFRAAFEKVHRRAIGETREPYMSVPARPDVDADLIVCAAIEELATARATIARLEAERDAARNCIAEALKWVRSAQISQGSRNLHGKLREAARILGEAQSKSDSLAWSTVRDLVARLDTAVKRRDELASEIYSRAGDTWTRTETLTTEEMEACRARAAAAEENAT